MKYLYFSASWCGPCKTLGPIMQQVATEVPVEKVDVDSNQQLAMQYSIRNVPTVVLVNGEGKEFARSVGVQPKEHYIQQYKNFS
jgi:thioredoxin 1